MRKAVLRIVALLLFVLPALTSAAPPQPVCPTCIIGFQCCIQGNHARCVPASHPCP